MCVRACDTVQRLGCMTHHDGDALLCTARELSANWLNRRGTRRVPTSAYVSCNPSPRVRSGSSPAPWALMKERANRPAASTTVLRGLAGPAPRLRRRPRPHTTDWRACAEETRKAGDDAEGCYGWHQCNLAKAER